MYIFFLNFLGISFTPKEVGEHLVSVFQAGKHIANSPFRIRVSDKEIGDPRRVRVSGPGLISGLSNKPNQFTVDTRDAGNNMVFCIVHNFSCTISVCSTTDHHIFPFFTESFSINI